MATVKQYMDGFNKSDKGAMTEACAAQASIIDEIPPHAWQGATACADWWNDNVAFNTKNGITDVNIPLREPSHTEINRRPCLCRGADDNNLQAAWEAGYRGWGGLDICVTKGFCGLAHNGLGVGPGALTS